jgi:hypothetical protein
VERLAQAIRVLVARVTDPDERRIAARTGALPVYADLAGSLLLTEGLEVLSWVRETDQVSREVGPKWTLVALRMAGERFAELATLRPRRPPGARDCAGCGGEGELFRRIWCDACSGLGWVAREALRSR